MRDLKEIRMAIAGFRLAVQVARDYDLTEGRMANEMVADALEWALGGTPRKFTDTIDKMYEYVDGDLLAALSKTLDPPQPDQSTKKEPA